MPKARCEIEFAIRLGDKPGVLGQLLSIVAKHSINVLAYCVYSDRQEGILLLVTDNPGKTSETLTAAGYNCRTNSVVLVGATDHVGSAADVGTRLGIAGVNILYSYASSAGADQFYAVFKTNDDARAVAILDHDSHTTTQTA